MFRKIKEYINPLLYHLSDKIINTATEFYEVREVYYLFAATLIFILYLVGYRYLSLQLFFFFSISFLRNSSTLKEFLAEFDRNTKIIDEQWSKHEYLIHVGVYIRIFYFISFIHALPVVIALYKFNYLGLLGIHSRNVDFAILSEDIALNLYFAMGFYILALLYKIDGVVIFLYFDESNMKMKFLTGCYYCFKILCAVSTVYCCGIDLASRCPLFEPTQWGNSWQLYSPIGRGYTIPSQEVHLKLEVLLSSRSVSRFTVDMVISKITDDIRVIEPNNVDIFVEHNKTVLGKYLNESECGILGIRKILLDENVRVLPKR